MSESRKSNRAINQKPKLFNVLPADVALPSLVCAGSSILLYAWFKLNGFICIGWFLWSTITYWLYVGNKPWINLAKLTQKRKFWVSTQVKYHNRDNIKLREK